MLIMATKFTSVEGNMTDYNINDAPFTSKDFMLQFNKIISDDTGESIDTLSAKGKSKYLKLL